MNVWLVGGDKVIPTSVEKAIQGDGYTVKRISGEDRYETAAKVAEAGIKESGKKPTKVFVASGTSFADALAVSPIAFAKGYPIILTEKDSTSDFSTKELGDIGTDAKILVGGEAVVSKAVAAKLSINESARVAGDDRAVTANLVSDWAKKSEGFNPANAALVGGTNGNGADSLVAASLGAKSFTTLHFAGWDATTTYLKDHSAELTGKGFVFGGKAAVSDDQVGKAQAAAQSVAVATTYTVTEHSANSATFKYADPGTKKAVSVTVASGDTFSVDGTPSSMGAFVSALTVGDVVSVSGIGSAKSWSLVNKTIMSGLLKGFVTTGTPVTSGVATIIEPSTGATIATFDSLATSSYNTFTVDGSTVSVATFASYASPGDSISVTGTGANASNIRTYALTNASVTGVVTAGAYNAAITVKTSAGASLQVAAPGAGDTFTIDGATKTKAEWDAATAVSVGDALTYSMSGGVARYALVNAAPAAIDGVVYKNGAGTAGHVYYWDGTVNGSDITLANVNTLKVDGTIVSPTEFATAATAGDWVSYQAADPNNASSVSSLTLTSKPVVGKVTVTGANTITIKDSDDKTLISSYDTHGLTNLYASGTSAAYSVDGVTKSQAQFDASLAAIQNGAKTGTIQVSISAGVVTYALATSVAPAPNLAAAAHTSTQTTVTVTFDKPVSATSAFAGGSTDFAVTIDGSPVTLHATTVPALSNGTLTITLNAASASSAANKIVTVTPSSTGLAKIVDANGNALTAGTISATIG